MIKLNVSRLLLGIAALYFVVAGTRLALDNSYDFVPVYTGARCLFRGCNPYNKQQLHTEYVASGGTNPEFVEQLWPKRIGPVYPPSGFVALLPLAFLPERAAQIVWLMLNAGLFLTAVALALDLCPKDGRWLGNLLAALFLLNALQLMKAGQPACLAVSLVVIAYWCFARRRLPILAACLLAVSLALKPQIGGLVVLFLLVERGSRRYALAAMAGAVAILATGVLVLQSRPQTKTWAADLHANIDESLQPGYINDPYRPDAGEVNLQTAMVILVPDAKVAALLTDGISALLLAAWIFALVKAPADSVSRTVLLGALAAFSMIPVYHRFYDTAFLLLALPAILLLYRARPALGLSLAVLAALANTPTQLLLNAWLQTHFRSFHTAILTHKPLFLLVLRQENLDVLGIFCLCLAGLYSMRRAAMRKAGGVSAMAGSHS